MIRFFLLKQQQATVGFGLFGGGVLSGGTTVSTTEKYIYTTNVVSAGTSLLSVRSSQTSCGNSVVGIFSSKPGTGTNAPIISNKYIFSNNSVSNGGSLPGRYSFAAFGDSTVGVFVGGVTGGETPLSSTEKYTYSNDNVAAGTSLLAVRFQHAACGNSVRGILNGGYRGIYGAGGAYEASSEKYTYSNNAVSSATSLSTVRYEHSATGNSSTGIFWCGVSVSSTELYNYSNDAVQAGTSVGNNIQQAAACSDSISGMFSGGNYFGIQAAINKYTYSTNVISSATSLLAGRYEHAACSSTPGHL